MYSIHSKWLKFLQIIWRHVLPIMFDDKFTRVILFVPNKVSIYSAYVSSIPFYDKLIDFKHLISAILFNNSLNPTLLNPLFLITNYLIFKSIQLNNFDHVKRVCCRKVCKRQFCVWNSWRQLIWVKFLLKSWK